MSKTGWIVIGVLLALFITPIVIGITSYISYSNLGARQEAVLKAKLNDNKQVYANFGNQVVETMQVADIYADRVKEVTSAAIEGRYGEGGAKAVFQMITEQNPTVDPSLFVQVQRIIEAGRKDFTNKQTALLDAKSQYEIHLNSVWSGFWLQIAGYPKINMDTIIAITSDRSEKAFEAGKDGPINLRQK